MKRVLLILVFAIGIYGCANNDKVKLELGENYINQDLEVRFYLEKLNDNEIGIYLEKPTTVKFDTFNTTIAYEPEKINIISTEVNPDNTSISLPRKTNVDSLQGIVTLGGAFNPNIPPKKNIMIAKIEFNYKDEEVVSPVSFISLDENSNVVAIVKESNVTKINAIYDKTPLIISN